MTNTYLWHDKPWSLDGPLFLVLTWRTGYLQGLVDSDQAKARGDVPVLLKLAHQDSPENEMWRAIQLRGFSLLSVSNRFAGEGWTQEELMHVVHKALQQSQEGLASLTQPSSLLPTPQVTQPSTTTELTDHERREYLEAIYGNTNSWGTK